jgi:hypothetical protein
VIETLLDCILDESGKIVGAPGVHDECLIVRGQALRRAVRRVGVDVPDARPPQLSSDAKLVRRIMGTDHVVEPPGGGPRIVERPRV